MAFKKQAFAKELLGLAARLVYQEAYLDFSHVKRKAAKQIGVSDAFLPSHDELFQAIQTYVTTDCFEHNRAYWLKHYEIANEAMVFLKAYEPVVSEFMAEGLANQHLPITLHVFASAPEELILFLEHQGVPCDIHDVRLKLDTVFEYRTEARFFVDDVPFELLVFSQDEKRRVPHGKYTGKPVRRLNEKRFDKLKQRMLSQTA